MTKYILSFVAIFALATAAHAGSCCGGGKAEDAKDEGAETTSVSVPGMTLLACCESSCDGDKSSDGESA